MTKPKRTTPLDLKSLARGHTEMCIAQLRGIAINSQNDGARVAAIGILLDRGWGKAEQVHSGNVDATINVIVRQIISDTPKVIENIPKLNSKEKDT